VVLLITGTTLPASLVSLSLDLTPCATYRLSSALISSSTALPGK
jgi:hypothetical protein